MTYSYISSLPLIDYGARMYDPTIARWMSVDPMAEKYYPMSPYGYCAGNPIILIDLKGFSFDDYSVNNNGYIKLLRRTDDSFDRLYRGYSEDGPNSSIIINDKDVLPSLEKTFNVDNNNKFEYSSYNSTDKKTISTIFKFLSDNTSVEWVVHKSGEVFTLGTKHNTESAGSWEDYSINRPEESIHSHPGNQYKSKNLAIESMGYWYNKQGESMPQGDWKNVLNDWRAHDYNESNIRKSYVYFPASKEVYKVGIRKPILVKTWK